MSPQSHFTPLPTTMFHTFQTTAALVNQAVSKNNPKSRRQSSTTHACEECRRRKIRCDGKLPCSHCEWYKHPKLCRYSKKQPRVVPSQKLLDELSSSLKQSQTVIEKLFPHSDSRSLDAMSRHELVDLILSLPASQPTSSNTTPILVSDGHFGRDRVKSEDAQAPLEALEEEPAADGYWDETQENPNGVPSIPDDVNGLSMSPHKQSSYVGVSSVAAALRVISKITTALESVIRSSPAPEGAPEGESHARFENASDNVTAEPQNPPTSSSSTVKMPSLAPATLIDAYFQHVHPMIPMIDEERFRADAEGERRDPAFLALLNMVYAMGTIAASTADDNSHLHYYRLAQHYLDFDLLGSSTIEAVQALGILGGYYLHYESKPNMANAVMGAAMRMACALGLHREYSEGAAAADKDSTPITREVRRRTWWSLFCLDTWASTSTGRPSLGRISGGVNVALPSLTKEKSEGAEGEVTDDEMCAALLCAQVGFCKIATRVQDRLAESPLLSFDETQRLDQELRHWWNNVPTMLRYPESCPTKCVTPRAVLSWRYHNLRLVLHRPTLLNNALRSSLENPEPPSDDEMKAVETCRRIGGEAIKDICNQWEATQMAGWNAVWLLFQAAMVPLVTLFAEYNRSNFEAVRDAQLQVQSVVDQLELMQDWSVTAKRSRDVVNTIFERNKLLVSHAREVMERQRKQQKEEESRKLQERREKEREEYRQRQTQSQSPVQHHNAHSQQQRQHSHPHAYSTGTPVNQLAFAHLDATPVVPSNMNNMYSHGGSASPPSAVSMGNASITGRFPPGLMMASQRVEQVPGVDYSGDTMMQEGAHVGTNYFDEDELNTFWNQMVWGDNDPSAAIMAGNVGTYNGHGGQFGYM